MSFIKTSIKIFPHFGFVFNTVGGSGVLATRERPGVNNGKNETHITELKYAFSLD
jgi:hypothetical protein